MHSLRHAFLAVVTIGLLAGCATTGKNITLRDSRSSPPETAWNRAWNGFVDLVERSAFSTAVQNSERQAR